MLDELSNMVSKIVLKSLRGKEPLKLAIAFILIAIGSLGRMLLLQYPNFEPVLASSLLAGSILGGYYSIVIPLSIMMLTDAYLALDNSISFTPPGFWQSIFIFTWSGFILVGIIGRVTCRDPKLSKRSIGRLTLSGILATLIYDIYTATGWWYLFYPHTISSLLTVYALQVPFTFMHLISSLTFVPLLSIPFLYMKEKLLDEDAKALAKVMCRYARA